MYESRISIYALKIIYIYKFICELVYEIAKLIY